MTGSTTSSTTSNSGTGLEALGCAAMGWRQLLEAAYETRQLGVAGELDGGQLLHFDDPSGVWFSLMTAPPYAAMCGFNSTAEVIDTQITMITDTLALLSLEADDGQPLADVAVHLSQGPLLMDEPDHPDRVTISALALDVQLEPEDETQPQTPTIASHGAKVIAAADGSQIPTAVATVTLPIRAVERRTNSLTGEKFYHAAVAAPFPLDVCLPADAGDVRSGEVIVGTCLLTARVAMPAGCGDSGGGCGSGGCGCGSGGRG